MRSVTLLSKPQPTKVTDLLVGDVIATKVHDKNPQHLRAVEAIEVTPEGVTLLLATPRKGDNPKTATLKPSANLLVVGDVLPRNTAKRPVKNGGRSTAVKRTKVTPPEAPKADDGQVAVPKGPVAKSPKRAPQPKAAPTLADRIAERLSARIGEIVDAAIDQAIDQAITKALG